MGEPALKIARPNGNYKDECRHCHRFLTIACRGVCCTCWRRGYAKLYEPHRRGPKIDEEKRAAALARKADELVAILKRAEQALIEIADDETMLDADNVMDAMCKLAETIHDEHFDATLCEEMYLPRRTRKQRGLE